MSLGFPHPAGEVLAPVDYLLGLLDEGVRVDLDPGDGFDPFLDEDARPLRVGEPRVRLDDESDGVEGSTPGPTEQRAGGPAYQPPSRRRGDVGVVEASGRVAGRDAVDVRQRVRLAVDREPRQEDGKDVVVVEPGREVLGEGGSVQRRDRNVAPED